MRKLMMGITTYNNMSNIKNIEKMMNNNNVFLCDDHSKDETFTFFKKKYPDRVIKTKNNNGNPSASRNLLIKSFSEKYDYITFCDGDDFLDYNIAKKSIPFRKVDMIFSDVLTVTNIGEYIFKKDILSEFKGFHDKLPAHKCLNMSGGRIYSLKVIKKYNLEYCNFPGQDTNFNFDVADHSKKIYITDKLSYTRYTLENSLSTNSSIDTLKKRIDALANISNKTKKLSYGALSLRNKNFEQRKELVKLYNSKIKFNNENQIEKLLYIEDFFDPLPTKVEKLNNDSGLTILVKSNFTKIVNLDDNIQYIYYKHNKIQEAANNIKHGNVLFMEQKSMVLNSDVCRDALRKHNKYNKTATIFSYCDINNKRHEKTIYELLLLNQAPVIFKTEMLIENGMFANFDQNREYLLSLLLINEEYNFIHSPEKLILSYSILKRNIETHSGVLRALFSEVQHYSLVPPKYNQTNDEAIDEYMKKYLSDDYSKEKIEGKVMFGDR